MTNRAHGGQNQPNKRQKKRGTHCKTVLIVTGFKLGMNQALRSCEAAPWDGVFG